MENNKLDNDSMLAALYNDVKKLVKHFKLDRRSQNNQDEQENGSTTNPEETEALKRLAETINGIAQQKTFTPEQEKVLKGIVDLLKDELIKNQDNNHSELQTALDKISQKLEIQTDVPKKTVKRYEFKVDFKDSKATATIIVMGILIMIASFVIRSQRETNADFRDNDLKYRYIKMNEAASGKDIYRLENIFEYNRNSDSIRMIRKRVELFERLTKEQAEKDARARLNAKEAEKLQHEAETVKGRK